MCQRGESMYVWGQKPRGSVMNGVSLGSWSSCRKSVGPSESNWHTHQCGKFLFTPKSGRKLWTPAKSNRFHHVFGLFGVFLTLLRTSWEEKPLTFNTEKFHLSGWVYNVKYGVSRHFLHSNFQHTLPFRPWFHISLIHH